MNKYFVIVEYADHKYGMKNFAKRKELVVAMSAWEARKKVKEQWINNNWRNDINQRYFNIVSASVQKEKSKTRAL